MHVPEGVHLITRTLRAMHPLLTSVGTLVCTARAAGNVAYCGTYWKNK